MSHITTPILSFWESARERYEIRRRKLRGDARPWTDDPAFQEYYFCNVHREHDRVTEWFRENVRDPLDRAAPDRLLVATTFFRWFNLPESGASIVPSMERPWFEQRHELLSRLEDRKLEHKLFGGAYIIPGPPYVDRLYGAFECIDAVAEREHEARCFTSLQVLHRWLTQFDYLGPFMAYEITCDMRYASQFAECEDARTWASLGPGSARGLQWVNGGGKRSYTTRAGQARMLEEVRELYAQASGEWPSEWEPLEMREVEHWLCEYDKYRRARAGEGSKRRYRPRKN